MLNLIAAVLIELIPGTQVGIYAPRHSMAAVEALSWSQSRRFFGNIQVADDAAQAYCFPALVIPPRRGEIFPLRRNMSAAYQIRIRRRAERGKPIYFSRIDRVPKVVWLNAMLHTQYRFVGEGAVDVGILQRSCEPK